MIWKPNYRCHHPPNEFTVSQSSKSFLFQSEQPRSHSWFNSDTYDRGLWVRLNSWSTLESKAQRKNSVCLLNKQKCKNKYEVCMCYIFGIILDDICRYIATVREQTSNLKLMYDKSGWTPAGRALCAGLRGFLSNQLPSSPQLGDSWMMPTCINTRLTSASASQVSLVPIVIGDKTTERVFWFHKWRDESQQELLHDERDFKGQD